MVNLETCVLGTGHCFCFRQVYTSTMLEKEVQGFSIFYISAAWNFPIFNYLWCYQKQNQAKMRVCFEICKKGMHPSSPVYLHILGPACH